MCRWKMSICFIMVFICVYFVWRDYVLDHQLRAQIDGVKKVSSALSRYLETAREKTHSTLWPEKLGDFLNPSEVSQTHAMDIHLRDIEYFPQSERASGTNVFLRLHHEGYVTEVRNYGAILQYKAR